MIVSIGNLLYSYSQWIVVSEFMTNPIRDGIIPNYVISQHIICYSIYYLIYFFVLMDNHNVYKPLLYLKLLYHIQDILLKA